MLTKSEIKRLIHLNPKWNHDEEAMAVWFRALYNRDFDHDSDGFHHGKDSRDNGTLESAIRYALK